MDIIGGLNTINFQTAGAEDYRRFKPRMKQATDDNMYYNMGYNVLLSVFDYDEDIYRPELLETFLHDTGVAGLIKTPLSDLTPVQVNIVGGELQPDGMLEDCVCYDLAGNEYQFKDWRNNPGVCIIFNNLTYTPDTFLSKYAYLLTNVDASIDHNVIYSRLKPIPVAKDQKTKNQIDQILTDLLNGKMYTVVTDSKLRDLMDSEKDAIEVINLTDVESSKYIQFLQNLHDSLISRMFFHMGLSISDNGKMAQVSIEELNKSKSASLSILNGWYIMRKRAFEDFKKKSGRDISFDFSDIWKAEWDFQVETLESAGEPDGGTVAGYSEKGGEQDENREPENGDNVGG